MIEWSESFFASIGRVASISLALVGAVRLNARVSSREVVPVPVEVEVAVPA
jgi:hypothetical protein